MNPDNGDDEHAVEPDWFLGLKVKETRKVLRGRESHLKGMKEFFLCFIPGINDAVFAILRPSGSACFYLDDPTRGPIRSAATRVARVT